MSKEEFFERLKERAETRLGGAAKYKAQGFVATQMYEAAVVAIDATIEALKELMVGEPLPGLLCHDTEELSPSYTYLWLEKTIISEGHIGTDGEEVTVMVLRDGQG